MDASEADIVCLSHLRWRFVYQRPNHLMARAAREHRVYFIEEPTAQGARYRLERSVSDGVVIVRPVVPRRSTVREWSPLLEQALATFLRREGAHAPWLWYYTPMALPWTATLPQALATFRKLVAGVGAAA